MLAWQKLIHILIEKLLRNYQGRDTKKVFGMCGSQCPKCEDSRSVSCPRCSAHHSQLCPSHGTSAVLPCVPLQFACHTCPHTQPRTHAFCCAKVTTLGIYTHAACEICRREVRSLLRVNTKQQLFQWTCSFALRRGTVG